MDCEDYWSGFSISSIMNIPDSSIFLHAVLADACFLIFCDAYMWYENEDGIMSDKLDLTGFLTVSVNLKWLYGDLNIQA